MLDGYGTYYKPDGTKYSGYWANGERNGKGKLTYSDRYSSCCLEIDRMSLIKDVALRFVMSSLQFYIVLEFMHKKSEFIQYRSAPLIR
jgi:hypothetical protein